MNPKFGGLIPLWMAEWCIPFWVTLTLTMASGLRGTVKPAVAATSIKRDPPLSGHFRAPRTILNANAP